MVCKINYSKSSIMGLNLFQMMKIEIAKILTACWNSSVRYLGIKISKISTILIDLNLRPIINSMRVQLECWQKVCLSWFGWVTALKIKIIPKFIFIFCNFIF